MRINYGNYSSAGRWEAFIAIISVEFECVSDALLLHCCCFLPRLVTSCCHHRPSPLYPLHTSIYPSPPFSPSFPSHCSAATTSRRWWACLSLLTLAAESTGRRDVGNKYLKGEGTELSQKCRNRHSIPPSEANVSKARGLVFVFSSGAL